MKIFFAFLFFIFLTACGTQPPLAHSEGPALVQLAMGRTAPARVDRGEIKEFTVLPGLVRIESTPLFFEMEGLPFDQFHVRTGQQVTEGQLLATLYTPLRREEVENQQLHINRLHRTHNLAIQARDVEIDLMHVHYAEQIQAAAENNEPPIREAARQILFDIDRLQLLREQEIQWQRIDRADAYIRLNELLENLQGTEIVAPFDGVITYVAPLIHGGWPGSGRRILYIAPLDAPHIVEYVGEVLPNRQRVTRIEGDISGRRINLTYKPLTREEVAYYSLHNLPRRTRFTFEENEYIPLGAAVRIFVYTVYIPETLRIPTLALFGSGMALYVYRMENGNWVPTNVTIGTRTTAFTEITGGLSEGDELLVN